MSWWTISTFGTLIVSTPVTPSYSSSSTVVLR